MLLKVFQFITTHKKWILLVVVLLLFFFFIKTYIRIPFVGVDGLEAVPRSSAFVLEIRDIEVLRKNLEEPELPVRISEMAPVQKLAEDLPALDTLFRMAVAYENIPRSGRILAAPFLISSNTFEYLYVLDDLPKPFSSAAFVALLENRSPSKITKTKFKNIDIYELYHPELGDFVLTTYRGLILFSKKAVCVETAISQLKVVSSNLKNDSHFPYLRKQFSNENNFIAYVNFEHLSIFSALFLNKEGTDAVDQLSPFVKWGAWAPEKNGEAQLDWKGFICVEYFNKQWKNLFSGSGKSSPGIAGVLPENTALHFDLNYNKIASVKEKDFQKYLQPWMEGSVTLAMTEPLNSDFSTDQIVVISIKENTNPAEMLEDYGAATGELEREPYQNFEICRLLRRDFFKGFLGEEFNFIHNPYYVVLDKHVVFANSSGALKLLLDKYIVNKTLGQETAYLLFDKTKNNVLDANLYLSTPRLYKIAENYIKEECRDSLRTILRPWLGFRQVRFQTTGSGKMLESTISFNMNKTAIRGGARTVWKTPLKSDAAIAPQVVKTGKRGEDRLLIQDDKHRLYALSPEGSIVWERVLEGRIQSKIHEIDYYDNKQYQFLFNTKNKIYLLDHYGEPISGFPRKLKSPATNGVAVYDFNNKKNYKIFIACNNGNIYGYQQNGKPLTGWRPKSGVGKIRADFEHFIINGKDHIIAVNDRGKLMAFAPDGKERFPAVQMTGYHEGPVFLDLQRPPRRIVAANDKGKAQVTNPRGKGFGLNLKAGKNEDVKLLMADVVGDSRKDFIVLSQKDMTVYYYNRNDFIIAFQKAFPEPQDEIFNLHLADARKDYIATLSRENRLAYLFNSEGELVPGFPIAATVPFVPANFSGAEDVLVVADRNIIIVYELQ